MMSRLKIHISRLFKSKKINVLLVFVLLALLFSLLTKLSKDYTKTISFDIEMTNVPSQYVILKDSVQMLDVTLTSSGFNLLKYYLINPQLNFDFSTIKRDKKHYVWTKNSQFQSIVNQFNVATSINALKPDTIKFNYDARFIKRLPVVLEQNIKFASGFDIDDSYVLEPDSIDVIGSKMVIDTLKQIKTETLSLSDVNSDINFIVTLNLPNNSDGFLVSSSQVEVFGAVTKFTEGSIFVPVRITNLPENLSINYFPKEIEVIFYTSLENYGNISINSFKVECDFGTLNDFENQLIPKIIEKPTQVKNLRLGTKSIEFIIKQ